MSAELQEHPESMPHEHVSIATGLRSGLTLIVAVHSTQLGPALGGCRLWHYASWSDGLQDALRLSEGMTAKNSVAGLSHGGGKSVILAPAGPLSPERRRDAFLDLGDLVESLDGRYTAAEDVGTTAADMEVVSTRTAHVVGLPESTGGQGDPGRFTARGVFVSMQAVLPRIGRTGMHGTRFAIAGLGQVGGRLARMLRDAGAELTVSDINPARRAFAEEIGATWVEPTSIHAVECDVFVPAGVGGMLTDQVIDELRCAAVVGPANNQLHSRSGAQRLAHRGIVYAPDFVVNAGGVIYLGTPGSAGRDDSRVVARIDDLGRRLDEVFDLAQSVGITTTEAAETIARRRLQAAAEARVIVQP